jgi:hypothetical protein
MNPLGQSSEKLLAVCPQEVAVRARRAAKSKVSNREVNRVIRES